MTTKKPSEEFEERKELILLQKKIEEEKHQRKMEELQFIRETVKLRHQNDMERQRIKSAEIRKAHERRELANMGRHY